jgi:hypothetical protein
MKRVVKVTQGPVLILLAFAALAVGTRKVLVLAHVYGKSMTPTLHKGDYILGLRLPVDRHPLGQLIRRSLIKRGAIILVRPPAHLGRLEVKRIDGLPGDLRNWGWMDSFIGPQLVPDNHVFLVSDASRHALPLSDSFTLPPQDSRLYGPCPSTAIVARVFLRFWPITRFGSLCRKP